MWRKGGQARNMVVVLPTDPTGGSFTYQPDFPILGSPQRDRLDCHLCGLGPLMSGCDRLRLIWMIETFAAVGVLATLVISGAIVFGIINRLI